MARQLNLEKAVFWKNHVEGSASSDLSQRKYCEENQIKEHSLIYWRGRLKMKSKSPETRFLPVKLMPDLNSPLSIKIENGISLEFSKLPDPGWLGQVLQNAAGAAI